MVHKKTEVICGESEIIPILMKSVVIQICF